jgi:hypothetical protein
MCRPSHRATRVAYDKIHFLLRSSSSQRRRWRSVSVERARGKQETNEEHTLRWTIHDVSADSVTEFLVSGTLHQLVRCGTGKPMREVGFAIAIAVQIRLTRKQAGLGGWWVIVRAERNDRRVANKNLLFETPRMTFDASYLS